MTCALCGKAGSYATVCTQCSITLNGQSFIDAVEAMQKALQRVMDMQAAKHP